MSKKLTIEFCKMEAEKRGYEIISTEYIKSIEKLTFFHSECGTYSDMSWSNFYSGHGCKKCASRKYGDTLLLKLEDCKEYALSQGYILNEELYYGNSENMNFIHIENNCNYSYHASWGNFYAGKRCPKCAGNIRLTIDFCKSESERRGYDLLSDFYVNNSTKMKFYHDECDSFFYSSWDDFSSGNGCPDCAQRKGRLKKRLTIDFCRQEAEKRGYLLNSTEYTSNRELLSFTHTDDDCGFVFDMKWNNFYNLNQNCPYCMRRKKESDDATTLKEYYYDNFNGVPEYRKCKNPKTGYFLPFDIFIPRYNDQGYDIFIEVQGHQHYKFNSMWHKDLNDFKYQQYKDRIKRKYAEQNGIYIEIDLRQKTPIEDIIQKINNTIQTYS